MPYILDMLVTSRVEGSHASLKQRIAVSTIDLDEVYRKIVLSGDVQHREISRQIGLQRMQLPIKFEAPFWGNVVRKISAYEMGKTSICIEAPPTTTASRCTARANFSPYCVVSCNTVQGEKEYKQAMLRTTIEALDSSKAFVMNNPTYPNTVTITNSEEVAKVQENGVEANEINFDYADDVSLAQEFLAEMLAQLGVLK
ncbi:hypothetical protein ABG067_001038 [Albugo candida]